MKVLYLMLLALCAHAIQSPLDTHPIPDITFSKQDTLRALQALSNPFEHSGAGQNIHIEAIINDRVLLNGGWYKKGDKIQGYTITALHPQYIILQKASMYFSLSLSGEWRKLEP